MILPPRAFIKLAAMAANSFIPDKIESYDISLRKMLQEIYFNS